MQTQGACGTTMSACWTLHSAVLYTCADVLATLSSSRWELSRGSRNNQSGCVVGDIDRTGGRVD